MSMLRTRNTKAWFIGAVVAGICMFMGFGFGVAVGYELRAYGKYIDGMSDGVAMTDKQWTLYMQTHCACWFDDARCKTNTPVVVCKLPNPIK